MNKLIKNGFTLIDTLLSLAIVSIVSLLSFTYLQTCASLINYSEDLQEQMGILQIREILMVSSDIQLKDNEISYLYNNKKYKLLYEKHRIVKKEGYEILIENIENAKFIEEKDDIYLEYKKNKKSYKVQIM